MFRFMILKRSAFVVEHDPKQNHNLTRQYFFVVVPTLFFFLYKMEIEIETLFR